MRTCHSCGASTRVLDTRDTHQGTRRRRECRGCGRRFTTWELDVMGEEVNLDLFRRNFEALPPEVRDLAGRLTAAGILATRATPEASGKDRA